jgi:spermidine synthase / saccharopine dehydrogenase (NADP+, L-glutamate-forming)
MLLVRVRSISCAIRLTRLPSVRPPILFFHPYLTNNPYLPACRDVQKARDLASGLRNAEAISLDVTSTNDLDAQVASHDLVISLIPYIHHAAVIKSAIKGKTHVVTTSYVSPAMRELDEEAKKAGIVVMNEIGLDPGIDHLYAIKTISEVHEKGGQVRYRLI